MWETSDWEFCTTMMMMMIYFLEEMMRPTFSKLERARVM